MRLLDLGEIKTIEFIKRIIKGSYFTRHASRFVKVGIGDDACVLKDGTIVTTDAYIENIHFSLDYFTIYEIGQRVVCGTLSDIAAMAGKPIALFVSALLPSNMKQTQLQELYNGMQSIANKFNFEIAGGDIVAYPKLGLVITVLGKTKEAKLRSTAKPGDYLYVTGYCGLSETGRIALKNRLSRKVFTTSIKRHTCPIPRINEALKLKKYINALIDTSDGLSTDVFHIASESNVKIKIFADKIPIHRETIKLYNTVITRSIVTKQSLIVNSLRLPRSLQSLAMTDFVMKLALNGGEDYELLFTSNTKNLPLSILGTKLTQIGIVESRPCTQRRDKQGRGVYLIKDNTKIPLLSNGYDHFKK